MFSSLFSRAKNPEERRIRAWCREKLGLVPGDLALYRQALRHSSAVPEDRPDLPNNERLEFLGDAVLDTIIGRFLFNNYPLQGEGFLTRMRSKLVSRHQLNILAQRVEIARVVESNIGRTQETSVPGNALEALIGAIFLDKGFDKTNKAVLKLITGQFDLKTVEQEDRDSKSRLLEWGQKKKRRVEFRITEEAGRHGRGKLYLAEACIDGVARGTGRGGSKKVAEQAAAHAAFKALRPQQSERGPGEQDARGERPQHARRRGVRGGQRNRGPRTSDGPRAAPEPTGDAPTDRSRRTSQQCRATFDRSSIARVAKLKLDIDPDPEVTLIGISSHVNDYRLCWSLNRSLGINLTRRDNAIEEPGPERMALFTAFDHTEAGTDANWSLVCNHSEEGVLLKEQKQADYFLVVDEAAAPPTDELLTRVRGAEFVLTAFPLDARKLKGAHKLLR